VGRELSVSSRRRVICALKSLERKILSNIFGNRKEKRCHFL
jgi:hypothetical protein